MANHYMQLALQKTYSERLRTECAALSGAMSNNGIAMTNANLATAFDNAGKVLHGSTAQWLKKASAALANTSGGSRVYFVKGATWGDIDAMLIHTDNNAFFTEMINDGNAVAISPGNWVAATGLSQT